MIPRNWDAEPDDYFEPIKSTVTLPEALARVERLRDERLLSLERAGVHAGLPRYMQQSLNMDAADAAALTRVLAEVQRLREALPTITELEAMTLKTPAAGLAPWCHFCRSELGEDAGHKPDCWIARLTAVLETPDEP